MSATDAVFEKLLKDIVSGVYSAGSRLPAERDLARQLGASRPTLREALRRLGEWNLVVPRRGSGIAVRPSNEWMIEVLPAFLRYGNITSARMALPQMVGDLLFLRRSLIRDILSMVATRVPADAIADARESVNHAWSLRQEAVEFVREDLNIIRMIVERADFLPGLWMINRLSGIYLDLARTVGAAIAPPETYVSAMTTMLDSLETGDRAAAMEKLDQYYAVHDERLLAILEFMK